MSCYWNFQSFEMLENSIFQKIDTKYTSNHDHSYYIKGGGVPPSNHIKWLLSSSGAYLTEAEQHSFLFNISNKTIVIQSPFRSVSKTHHMPMYKPAEYRTSCVIIFKSVPFCGRRRKQCASFSAPSQDGNNRA